MRSILFEIDVHARIALGPLGEVPVLGLGLMLVISCLFGLCAVLFLGTRRIPLSALVTWGVATLLIVVVPLKFNRIPIYGYGMMLFIGFVTATGTAARRIYRQGYDGEIAWDCAIWLFLAGIVGARAFYVIQYPDLVFKTGNTLRENLLAVVMLPDGGIVFYGGLIGGAIAYALYCRHKKINTLAFADIAITSLFIGMMFGRIGCILHGCCYGDYCTLPWAVTFPPESVPVRELLNKGFTDSIFVRSLPLHPTQIYSAIGSGLLVLLTWAYYPFRQKDGSVLLLGWLTYPIHRFIVEFLRGDEIGQFGTSLTISQWVSLGLWTVGVFFAVWLHRQPARVNSLVLGGPAPAASFSGRGTPVTSASRI